MQLKPWESSASSKQKKEDFENPPSPKSDLNKLLRRFYANTRKQDRDPYKQTSFRNVYLE